LCETGSFESVNWIPLYSITSEVQLAIKRSSSNRKQYNSFTKTEVFVSFIFVKFLFVYIRFFLFKFWDFLMKTKANETIKTFEHYYYVNCELRDGVVLGPGSLGSLVCH